MASSPVCRQQPKQGTAHARKRSKSAQGAVGQHHKLHHSEKRTQALTHLESHPSRCCPRRALPAGSCGCTAYLEGVWVIAGAKQARRRRPQCSNMLLNTPPSDCTQDQMACQAS